MSITSALVLFAVIWFLALLIILPLRLTTQGEAGDVVPGTPSSAPSTPNLGKKMRLATIVAVVLWCVAAAIILSGVISVRDLDWFNRMGPAPVN